MFKISAIVKPDALGGVLQTLYQSAEDVQVTPANAAPAIKKVPPSHAGRTPAIIKGSGTVKKRGAPRDGSLQNIVLGIIEGYGRQFRLADLAADAEAKGQALHTVMRALGVAQKRGLVTKVTPGLYQRTGAAFAESLGVAGNA